MTPPTMAPTGAADDSVFVSTTPTVGVVSTMTPSWADAASGVARTAEREDLMAAEEVPAGTSIVAVMSTLAASTVTVTLSALTPATAAMLASRLVVSL